MSNKRCIFKNCTTTGAGEVTLFSFPKDQGRKKIWLELAGRPQYTPQKSDYLCELHFGPQFISTNQRRKILVGLAIPFRPVEQLQRQQHENDDEMLEDRLEDDLQDIFGGEGEENDEELERYSESYSDNSVVEHETITDSAATIVCDDAVAPDNDDKKRKVNTVATSATNGSVHPTKLMKIDLNSIRSKSNNEPASTISQHIKEKVISKVCTTTVFDHPDVSTFHIRGEEFIQMPKAVYFEEKERLEKSQKNCYAEEISKLKNELEMYKKIVLNIKNELKSVSS